MVGGYHSRAPLPSLLRVFLGKSRRPTHLWMLSTPHTFYASRCQPGKVPLYPATSNAGLRGNASRRFNLHGDRALVDCSVTATFLAVTTTAVSLSFLIVRQTAEWFVAVASAIFMVICSWRQQARMRRSRACTLFRNLEYILSGRAATISLVYHE